MKKMCYYAVAWLWSLLCVSSAFAWDYEGHRVVNQLALASLPTNFPAFARTPEAAERIAFLSGEPDRWRNTPDLPLKHSNNPEHYLDMEELADYGLKLEMLPVFRYDFVGHLALVRKAHPDKFPQPEAAKNEDHTRELIGFLPWGLAEYYGKLKSGFSYLKAYQEDGGTPEEIANAQANIIYIMGVMGHLAGDAAQPLHTTVHHHGWVGPNPNGYTTNRNFHSWIDGGFFVRIGGLKPDALKTQLRPAGLVQLQGRTAKPEEIFQAVALYLGEQHKQLEPLYRLEKEGKLAGTAGKGRDGQAFLEAQLIKAGQFLGDLYYSAWQQAPPDTFLKGQLARRSRKASGE